MEHKRKKQKNDNFKLIQEDFSKNQNKTEVFPKRRKKLNYVGFELFQDHNFEEGQIDADMFYKEHKFVPNGFFVFYSDKEENPNKEKIKNIFIRILKSCIYEKKFTKNDQNEIRDINKNFKLYELFTHGFWKRIGIDRLFNKFHIERHLNKLKDRKEWGLKYVFDFIDDLIENIWNKYCLTEGKTSIERESSLPIMKTDPSLLN